MKPAAGVSPGLLDTVRSLLGALLEIGSTRLQLASTELEEERLRLAVLLLYATFALFFLGLGVVLAAMLLVLLFWDGPRTLVLGLLAATFLAVGAVAGIAWWRKAGSKPRVLAGTLDELQRDLAALRAPPAAGSPP